MEYFLQDILLLESNFDFDFDVWQPKENIIVLGRSDSLESSVFEENAKKLDFKIIKRPSGGHTVVLTPKTVVISMIFKYNNQKPTEIFFEANSFIIECLEKLQLKNIQQKGISDICIGEKKILGSSMYKKTDKYFYHAVLNYSQDSDIFEILLKHPSSEPKYRDGRSHKDFVTSLIENNFNYSIDELIANLTERLEKFKSNFRI